MLRSLVGSEMCIRDRHSTSGRHPNFAALNRGRHLCSAGRPSRWALAHILVLLLFFFPRLISAVPPRLDVYHTSTNGVALVRILECRSETCCKRLAENTGRKKSTKNQHLGTIAQIFWAVSSNKTRVDNRKKNLLNINISPTCLYNMVNFGPLAAEIVSLVWGTPGNFNGFRVLAALLHGTLVVGVSQTLRR